MLLKDEETQSQKGAAVPKAPYSVRSSPSVMICPIAAIFIGVGAYLMGPNEGVTEEIGKADIGYAKELWSVLANGKVVGKDANPPKPSKSQDPHGPLSSTTYTEAVVKGHRGKLAVQHNYRFAGGSVADVVAKSTKHVSSVDVMFKREAGYDPDHNDWFWVKYDPSGNPTKGSDGASQVGQVVSPCVDCHAEQKGQDFLFRKKR